MILGYDNYNNYYSDTVLFNLEIWLENDVNLGPVLGNFSLGNKVNRLLVLRRGFSIQSLQLDPIFNPMRYNPMLS